MESAFLQEHKLLSRGIWSEFRADHERDMKCVCVCAGAVRASSIFPILSVILLFMGGLCVAASEFYQSHHNIILSAGIFFVSAGEHINTNRSILKDLSELQSSSHTLNNRLNVSLSVFRSE